LTVAYGARYAVAAGALALAAGVALLNTLNSLVTALFFAADRPALHRRAVGASAIIMLIAIYPACKYFGLVGGQMAALVAIAVSYFLQVIRAREITGLSIVRYGKSIVPATLVSAGVVAAGFGAKYLGLTTRPAASIAVAAGACIIAYILCVPTFARIRETA
jgi:O-antigen/teichoic acid export membrane protein